MCELCSLNVQINELVGPRGDQDAMRSWACTEFHRIYRHWRTTLHEEANGRVDLVWRSRCGPRCSMEVNPHLQAMEVNPPSDLVAAGTFVAPAF